MSGINTRHDSARRSLYSGKLDVEGMDHLLGLYRDLFRFNEEECASTANRKGLAHEEAKMRLAEGFVLNDPADLLLDPDEIKVRAGEVIQILVRHSEDAEGLKKDAAILTAQPPELNGLAQTYLAEGEEALRNELEPVKGSNPEVVMFVLFNALKSSFLQAAARCDGIDTSPWGKNYCPVCGGEPAVSYLVGEGGRKYLICFRCETHWRYRRFSCPKCGHEDPGESLFLYAESRVYRNVSASVCRECQTYIKTWRVEGRHLGDTHPEIEDLKTPGFDNAVEEKGFYRGSPNIYGVWIGTLTDETPMDD